jgi:copper chaperone CopZ
MQMQILMDGAIELSIEGMTCSGCVKAVTRALSQVPGVTAVTVDLDAGQAMIEGNVSPRSLVAAVEQAGFDANWAQDNDGEQGHGNRA